jgi:sensor histidine kinase YesM
MVNALLMPLLTLWNTISYTGVQPDLPLDLRKKIILCNRISLTISVVVSGAAIPFFSVPTLFVIYLLAGFTYLSPLVLNRLGYYTFSRSILTFTPPLFILATAGFSTQGASITYKFELLSLVIAPILLFQVSESRKMSLGIAWILLAFLSFDPVTQAISRLAEIPNDQMLDNSAFQTVSALVNFTLLVAAFVYQQRINHRVEGQLQQTIAALDAKNQLIGQQNAQLQQQFEEIERQKAAIERINHGLRLQALKAQLNPHFVFNALNSIQHFVMQKNPIEALGFLSKFAKLIRQVLENSLNDRVPIADELKGLSYYLDLEKLRFDNQFSYQIEVDEELDPLTTEIPPMLLQPYVENAILHGLRHRADSGGLLKLHLLYQFDQLLCIVEDNGIGRAAAQRINEKHTSSHISRGTAVTDKRLQLLNHDTAEKVSVVLIDLFDEQCKPAGLRVEITVPI